MSFPPNLGITNSFIIDSTSSIFHEFPSLLPHLDTICSPFSKHRMNGYSRIKKSNTNRSKSVDFAELSLTRIALTPSKFSAVKIATVHDPIPEHEADDGAGEVFGAILGRKSCVTDRNSEAEKGAAALQEAAAAKRSISIKRSASVSDGYSRIHHRCAEDDDGEESGNEFISHAKGVKKKKERGSFVAFFFTCIIKKVILEREREVMAHLHHNLSLMVKGSGQELLRKYGGMRFSNMSFMNERRRRFKENKRLIIQCCTSSTSTSSSADQQLNLKLDSRLNKDDESELGSCLVRDGKWQVRRMLETEEEMSQVASVQAEAFHEPVFLFDDFFFYFFEAEVLSGLLYRLRNSPPDRYACLVAEPRNGTKKELAGVVDVTVLSEDSVLQHLLGAKEYIYVSGIAVLSKFRRQKVATALLKACEILSSKWGFDYLALRAYEDDHGARKLYSNAGYRVVSQDPPWTTSWIGRRRRVLMVKETNIQDIRALD